MTGRVTVKNGYWNIVINYKAEDGTYKQHWKKTDLKERGNKKIAEKQMSEEMAAFALELKEADLKKARMKRLDNRRDIDKLKKMTIEAYVRQYVQDISGSASISTERGYRTLLKIIEQYIVPKKIKLCDITTQHIMDFYDYKLYYTREAISETTR